MSQCSVCCGREKGVYGEGGVRRSDVGIDEIEIAEYQETHCDFLKIQGNNVHTKP